MTWNACVCMCCAVVRATRRDKCIRDTASTCSCHVSVTLCGASSRFCPVSFRFRDSSSCLCFGICRIVSFDYVSTPISTCFLSFLHLSSFFPRVAIFRRIRFTSGRVAYPTNSAFFFPLQTRDTCQLYACFVNFSRIIIRFRRDFERIVSTWFRPKSIWTHSTWKELRSNSSKRIRGLGE